MQRNTFQEHLIQNLNILTIPQTHLLFVQLFFESFVQLLLVKILQLKKVQTLGLIKPQHLKEEVPQSITVVSLI